MNRTRLLFIGVIALALGGLLASVVYRSLQRSTAPARAGTDVVIAANDIAVGAKLSDNDLRVVQFPAQDLPNGYFHSKARAIGRGVILPISRGEFILTNKLAGENAALALTCCLPEILPGQPSSRPQPCWRMSPCWHRASAWSATQRASRRALR